MSNTQIDTLLQLTLPRSESTSPNRARDDNSPFDQLFQQASGVKPASSSAANSSPTSSSQSSNTNSERRRDSQDSASSSPPTAPAATSAEEQRDTESSDENDETYAEDSHGADVVVATVPTAPSVAEDKSNAPDETATEEAAAVDGAKVPTKKPHGKSNVQAKSGDANDAALPDPTAVAAEEAAAESESLQALAQAAAEELRPAEASADDAAVESARATNESAAVEAAADVLPNADEQGDAEGNVSDKDLSDKLRGDSAERDAPQAVEDLPATETNDASSNQSVDGEPTAVAAMEAQSAESSQVAREETATAEGEVSRDDSNASNSKRETAPSTQVQPAPASRPVAAIPPAVVTPAAAANAAVKGDGATNKDSGPRQIGSGPKEGVLATFARFERTGALASRGPQQAGEGRDVPHVDPAKFVSRVARAIQTAQDRGTPLLLRLNPPELGSLKLEMSVQHGTLSASVEADNQAAKQLLLENLPALRERLADQNIRIERFDVDVRRDGDGREQPKFNLQQQQHESNQGRQSHRLDGPHGRGGEVIADAVTIVPHSITTTTINVVA
jgi:flagellar hook-length control protein FliK